MSASSELATTAAWHAAEDRAERAEAEIAAWREVAAYYLGDMADTATADECRREAFRRTTSARPDGDT